jgi:catalase
VLYDAVVVPDGEAGVTALMRDANALDFVRQQYRHCKPIMVVGAGAALLEEAGVPAALPDGSEDLGLVGTHSETMPKALAAFKQELAGHRSFARESDPPMV